MLILVWLISSNSLIRIIKITQISPNKNKFDKIISNYQQYFLSSLYYRFTIYYLAIYY